MTIPNASGCPGKSLNSLKLMTLVVLMFVLGACEGKPIVTDYKQTSRDSQCQNILLLV